MSVPGATIRAMPGDPGRLPAPVSPAAPGAGPAATDPDELVPHVGTDEADKGDYFGPLVCAPCYLDADATRTLRALGGDLYINSYTGADYPGLPRSNSTARTNPRHGGLSLLIASGAARGAALDLEP